MTQWAGLGNTLVVGGFTGTWADLMDGERPPIAAVVAGDHLTGLTAVWRHVTQPDRETAIVHHSRLDEQLIHQLRTDGFTVTGSRTGECGKPLRERTAVPGRVWLTTSGSTGRPKLVAHTLHSLSTVTEPQPPRRWLVPYGAGTYAWWQLVMLSLECPGQDLVTVEVEDRLDWLDIAVREEVTAISGTPSFWRRALWRYGDALGGLNLQQITLGGEPVPQVVLDRLARCFPQARISWIYASSEAGATVVVHDRRAGFPVEWLDRRLPGQPLLRVVDGELLVESPHHAENHGGLIATGDRAEIIDGRVHLTGRLGSDEINVGGSKAAAATVANVLDAHPAVAWARVYPRRAALVGNLVAADVVLHTPASNRDLTEWCARRLPDFAVPRHIRFLADIPIEESLKTHV